MTCKKLCEQAEDYINQDHIGINHIQYMPEEDMTEIPEQLWPSGLSTIETIIQYYFRDRLTQVKISKRLNISRQYVGKIIKNYRRRLIKITSK